MSSMPTPAAQPVLGSWNRDLPLHEVFDGFQSNVPVPSSRGSIVRAQLRRLINKYQLLVYCVVALQAAAVGVGFALDNSLLSGVGIWTLFLPTAIVLVVLFFKADNLYWKLYEAARGLKKDDTFVHLDTPLGYAGDERKFDRQYKTSIIGVPADFGHYTYTDITHSTDADGHRTTTRHDHQYTVVRLHLPGNVAQRYLGVFCRKKHLEFGGLQDRLTDSRSVKLESLAFEKKYTLRAADSQDDVALFELFSTTFADALAEKFTAQWEQVGDSLVGFRKGHCCNTEELDELFTSVARVYLRYCEEYM